MQTSFPFNAVLTSQGYDRVYTAEDFAAEKAAYMSDGTLSRASLKVTPVSGRTVSISAGTACIRGRTYRNSDSINITLALSDAVHTRIDRIVLRLDYTERNILLQLKQGTPASNPSAPNITDNEQMCEIPIAKITVSPNASVISSSAIADERILASFPLDYDEIVAEYTKELRNDLGVDDLRELKKMAQCVIVNGSGNAALFDDGIYRSAAVLTEAARYTSSGAFSTYEHPSKDNLYHIVLLGGGGGGSAKLYSGSAAIPSGGGAGAMFNMGPLYIPSGVHSVTVGAGGAGVMGIDGGNGGDTSILSYIAGGGRGGDYTTSSESSLGGTGISCYPGESGAKKSAGGKGGSSLHGTGGNGYTSNGATGASATGYGAGGGCGGDGGSGGNGSGGLAIIYAYR